MEIQIKECLTCWNEFKTHNSRAKFCSRKCKDNFIFDKICELCWWWFKWTKNKKCCSDECSKALANKKREETSLKKNWVRNPAMLQSSKDKAKETIMNRYWWWYTSTDEYKSKRIATSLEKYWTEHYSQTDDFKKKVADTCLKKYWKTSYSKTDEYKEKVINTNIKKYWAEHYMKTNEWKDRLKEIMNDKYWVDYYTQTSEYKDKAIETNISKYWKEYYSQTDERKNRFINTCIEKYWVDNPSKLDEVKEKVKQTNIKKYWKENVMFIDEFKNKVCDTNIERYWEKYYTQTEGWIKKISDTCMEKYWVPFHCMTKECTNASEKNSNINKKIQQLFTDNGIVIDDTDFPIERYQYDIKVWNVLVEINPSVTHYTLALRWMPFNPLDKNYHKNKTILARDNWYRCINVFDWDDINKVIYMLKPKNTIYARKCEIKEIDYETAHELFDMYHLQWDTKKCKSNMYIWLYYESKLVECMSFWKSRYNNNYEWEILRLCTSWEYNVIWWASKIFKYFLDNTDTDSVISYCDMSKFDWSVYEQLWFKLIKRNSPWIHWWYMWKKSVWCPMHIWSKALLDTSFDSLLWKYFWIYWKWSSNEELMMLNWYVWVYDAWQAVYWYKKEKERN